jgi:hypothetical protein
MDRHFVLRRALAGLNAVYLWKCGLVDLEADVCGQSDEACIQGILGLLGCDAVMASEVATLIFNW